MTVKILSIHEDYVIKTMFTLTEWLTSPSATKFQIKPKYMQDMSKEELNVCLKFFTRLQERKMAHIAKSIRAAIDHFLPTPPHNQPISLTRQINY